MDTSKPGGWFRRFGSGGAVRRRLVCFHHAGGGPSLFRDWHRYVDDETEVWAAALPGRELRFVEAPIDRLEVLAEHLVRALPQDLPFAFFGHSLGGVVAFEVARRLHEWRAAVPQRLFVSSSPAPHRCRRSPSRGTFSDDELLRLLAELGGTPEVLLRHPEYAGMLLSVLRADLDLIDTYQVPDSCGARFPIVAYAGTHDISVPAGRMEGWARWATTGLVCRQFEGGHFYLNDHTAALIRDMLSHWSDERRSASRPVSA